MKKLFTSIVCLLTLSSLSWGQQLSIITPGDNNILNDSTIYVYGNDTTEMLTTFWIINISSNSLNVYARRDYISVLSGDSNAICWSGYCYANTISVSPYYETIGAHDTANGANTFNGHYTAYGAGSSLIRYTFYNATSMADSAWVLVDYISATEGVASINNENINLSVPYPNPANNTATISYHLGNGVQTAQLKVLNLLGQDVQNALLTSTGKRVMLNVQSLPSGIYICEVEAKGAKPEYQKLVVSH